MPNIGNLYVSGGTTQRSLDEMARLTTYGTSKTDIKGGMRERAEKFWQKMPDWINDCLVSLLGEDYKYINQKTVKGDYSDSIFDACKSGQLKNTGEGAEIEFSFRQETLLLREAGDRITAYHKVWLGGDTYQEVELASIEGKFSDLRKKL